MFVPQWQHVYTSPPTACPCGHGLFNCVDTNSLDAELQLDYFREISVTIFRLKLEN